MRDTVHRAKLAFDIIIGRRKASQTDQRCWETRPYSWPFTTNRTLELSYSGEMKPG